MIGTVATNITLGILANLTYDTIFQKNDEDLINDKVYEAYEKAKKKFYSKYGDRYGDDLNSFLERQSNIDIVVNSLFYSREEINHKDIDIRSFYGRKDGTKEAVIDFITMLHEEMHNDYKLDEIITQKRFIADSKKDHEEIKEGIANNSKKVEGLKNFIADIFNKNFIKFMDKLPFDIALSNHALNIANIELPEEIRNGIDRKETVSTIIKSLDNSSWYHLKGGVGSGKTQLLLLLCKRYKGKKIWINVKGLNPNQAVSTINSILSLQTNTRANNYTEAWYEKAISHLKPGDVIVIDDIPKLIYSDSLANLLTKIAIKSKEMGVKLFTSSSNDVGLKVKQSLGNSIIKSEIIPSFNDNEIEELLYIKGAPNNKAFKLSQWISVVSKNNPSIINLLGDYLSMENWDINYDVYEKINSGYYLEELTTEIQNILITSIKDSQAKQLLYRLTIIDKQFTNRHIQEIASVEPRVDLPFEKITELLGYWITKKDNYYLINPLVSKIGVLNLDAITICKVHKKVAELIMENKVLTPLEVIQLITHSINAKEFNQAGHVFLHALLAMNTQEIENDYWGLTGIWKSIALPIEIDYDLQIKIRVIQIMTLSKFEENDIDFIIKDLEKLLLNNKKDRDEEYIRTLACFSLAIHFMKSDGKKSITFMKEALTNYNHKLLELTESEITPEEMIWLPVALLNDHKEIDYWIDMVTSLSREQIERAMQSELYNQCATIIADRIWFCEYEKKESDRDWEITFKQFQAMENLAKNKEMKILEVCIIRAKLIVYGEHLGELEKGEILANNYLLKNEFTIESTFLIKSMLGKQYLLKKQHETATPLLQEALKFNNYTLFPVEYIEALTDLSLCEDHYNNKRSASELLSRAIKITNNIDYVADIQKAKIMGELSISLWKEGKIDKAYFSLQEATELLLQNDLDNRSWKCLSVILGHVIGYYSSVAKSGIPPKGIIDGEGYQKPTRGIFQSENDDLEEAFNFEKMVHLMTLLYLYAEAIGEYSEAQKWLFKGYEWIKDYKIQNNITGIHLSSLTTYLILEEKFFEAINVSIESNKILRAGFTQSKTEADSESDVMFGNIEVGDILSRDKKVEDNAYLHGVYNSIVPIVLYVCNIHIKDPFKSERIIQSVIYDINEHKTRNKYLELWNEIEKLFSMLLNPNVSSYEKVNDYENIDASFKEILQGTSYIITSMYQSSGRSLDLHIKSISWVEGAFRQDTYGTEKILKPFYKDFWLQRYIRDRFSFQNTEDIDEKLQKVLKSNSSNITKEILQTMNLGFNLPIDPRVFNA